MKRKQYIQILEIPQRMTREDKVERIEKLAAKMKIKIGGKDDRDKRN